MALFNNSPNMNMPVPAVGIDPGPDWANNINTCLSIVDQHNHSSGNGVQIQPNGINISSDLPFNSHNATLLRATRFSPQTIAIPNSGADIGELYVVGNELYYNDVTGGNQVKITTNGSVNAGAGSISGLPSGTASASFAAGTFVFQSATNTAATIDGRNYILRNSSASSKGLTLQPPAAMAADYSLTLPTVPGSQSFVTLDASGNFGAGISISGGLTTSNLSASAGIVGTQLSSSADIVGTQLANGTLTTTQLSASAGILATQNATPVTWGGTGSANTFSSGSHIIAQITSFNPALSRPLFYDFHGNTLTDGYFVLAANSFVSFKVTINGFAAVQQFTLTTSTVQVAYPFSILNCISPFPVTGGPSTTELTVVIGAGSITYQNFGMGVMQI